MEANIKEIVKKLYNRPIGLIVKALKAQGYRAEGIHTERIIANMEETIVFSWPEYMRNGFVPTVIVWKEKEKQ